MKRCLLFSLLSIICAFFAGCRHAPGQEKLEQLDAILNNRDIYESSFLNRMNSLRSGMAASASLPQKWEYADSLFRAFRFYDIDSSAKYVSVLYEYAENDPRRAALSKMADIHYLCSRRDYSEAIALLESLDPAHMDNGTAIRYYFTGGDFCASIRNDSQIKDDYLKDYYRSHNRFFRQECMRHTVLTSHLHCKMSGLELRADGFLDAALDTLLAAYSLSPTPHDKAVDAYNIATTFRTLGDMYGYKRWLAESACWDLRMPSREYRSLYDLALLLYEEGDLHRATRYIQICLTDYLACKYPGRIFNASVAQGIINAAQLSNERSRRRSLYLITGLISMLLLVIAALLRRTARQKRRLSVANASIRESSLIKDNYLFRYMELSSGYIKNLDEYRHIVMRTYKKEGIDSLMKLLRQPSPAYVQYDDYYRLFDEVFMGIFPDFLDRVNAMLQEGSRLSLSRDGSFPTKLRILAVMRLGLEDSGKIADFLNCSAQTVYSYRTQMRNAATCPRDEFEKRILQIGIAEE